VNKVLGNKLAIIIFVVPALILFLALVFLPIINTFVYSLYSGTPGLQFDFVGIKNYINMWKDKAFLGSLSMSLRYVGIVTTGQVTFGLLTALMFHFSIKKYKTLTRTIVFFPVVLPGVAVAQLFSKLFEISPQYGIVNAVLDLVGLDQFIQPWLGQSKTAFSVLCMMDVWTAIGFYAVIIYGALVDISEDIIESARIDGAGGFRLFRSILLPNLRNILTACFIFSLTGTLKMFESATALTKGGPGAATKSLSMFMYERAFNFSEYGYGSAIAIFILVECLLATGLVGIISRRKE
jgi:raffinose/stachyose/melibiose transport system permease protein